MLAKNIIVNVIEATVPFSTCYEFFFHICIQNLREDEMYYCV
jgi:hypothetical protein